MNTITFPYYKPICGYIKLHTLSEEDYTSVIKLYEGLKLDLPELPKDQLFKWLHYQADILMLNYYIKYEKAQNSLKRDAVRKKTRYLYDKLTGCYPEFYDESDIKGNTPDYEYYDFSMLKVKLKVLVESGYPHQVLSFCYRNLVDDWGLKRIIDELSHKNLDMIYSGFINEYSRQTDLPTFVLNLYFLSLKEKLNLKLNELISKNDSVTAEKLKKYIDSITGWTVLEIYYGRDCDHDISDWCNKIKTKAIRHLASKLNK